MKKAIGTLFVAMISMGTLFSQDVTRVQAMSNDISDNLDLEAVASVFADSENLEDFEKRLNDPESRISNLDMNEDGYVDYLRVVENSVEGAKMISIQAVIGKDLYQDVATIDVEVDDRGQTRVQVVGDVYMYGPDYIIEPVYRYRPRIYAYLWAPRINPWCSTYYWGYYPNYWTFWTPFSYSNYYAHSHGFYGHHAFYYRSYRRSYACANAYGNYRRNDYAYHHPNRGFTARNDGYRNKMDRDVQRGISKDYTHVDLRDQGANSKDLHADARPMNTSNTKPMAQAQHDGKGNSVSTRPVSKEGNSTNPHTANTNAAKTDPPQESSDSSRPQAERDRTNAASQSRPQESNTQARPSSDVNRPTSKPSASESRPQERPSSSDHQSTRPSSSSRATPAPSARSGSSSKGSASQASPSRSGSSSRSSSAGTSSRSSAPSSSGKSTSTSGKRK